MPLTNLKNMNATLEKFGYPDSIIKSYQYWSVLLRPQQVTLGAMILGCNDQSERFSDLPVAAMTELSTAIGHIESVLTHCFNYDKINYLMLMMVDPHVHFHVIPRYQKARQYESLTVQDSGWPGPPDLSQHIEFTRQQQSSLLNYLRKSWVA